VSAVCELHTIFGLTKPRSQQCTKSRRKIAFDSWLKINRVVHSEYKFVHELLEFVHNNGEGSWVKILKWKFATFFAFYRNQDLPKCPDLNFFKTKFLRMPDHLMGGYHHQFLMHMKRDNPDKFKQFLDSSQQLKKAMPDVPLSMVDKAEHDTMIELTSEPEVLPEIRDPVVLRPALVPGIDFDLVTSVTKQKVVDALRRTVNELFDGECFDHHDIYEPFFPSTSANYIWSRGNCGALSELYEKVSFGKRGDQLEFGSGMCSLFQEVSQHYGLLGKSEQNKIVSGEELGYETIEQHPTLYYDQSQLRQTWKEEYRKIFDLARNERPLVKTVGLPEPLKVRVISKGPPLLYTALKPVQKWLWTVLKKHKVFALIGRYVLPDDINRVLGPLEEGEEAVSGDYVSSTNKLHSWVSEVILDQLMINIGEQISVESLLELPKNFLLDLREMMLKALTKHIFVEEIEEFLMKDSPNYRSDGSVVQYKKLIRHELIEHPQKRGQLMGSIVSFPFLCIANAAVCRLALEESTNGRKSFRLRDNPFPGSGPIAPLLINGDDCLLKGKVGILRRCWEANTAVAGLESSIGKTYFSRNFCTINSTIFEWNGVEWVERKYVNLGLMMGKKRLGAGCKQGFSPHVPSHQLGTICRELKRSCPPDLWPTVKKRFIFYNRKELDRYPEIPWFAPEWLGGLGLPVDTPEEISRMDRCCATIIKAKLGRRDKDMRYIPVQPKEAAMWLMHKRVLKDLEPFKWIEKPLFRAGKGPDGPFILDDEYSGLYKAMTINLLMKEPLNKLYEELDEDRNVRKGMRHNAKIWLYAQRDLKSGSHAWVPMTDEDMAYEQKGLVIPCVETDLRDCFWSLGEGPARR